MNKSVYLGLSILEISKIVMYEFDVIMWNQTMERNGNYATWLQTVL